MKIGITILGSGSKGNAILLHTHKEAVLIDAGFSRKQILLRLEKAGISPSLIKGAIITHEHGDHTQGARLISDHLGIPVYTTDSTIRYLIRTNRIGERKKVFQCGASFKIGELHFHSFNVPHDAVEPLGLIVSWKNRKIGIATDLGYATKLVKQRLKGCNALIWEYNHDVEMLKNSDRDVNLKRRILGRHGHLCNEDALDALDELLTKETKLLFPFHISRDCNSYELVRELTAEKLKSIGRSDISFFIAQQDSILNPVWL